MQIIDFLLDILFSKYSEGKLKKKEMGGGVRGAVGSGTASTASTSPLGAGISPGGGINHLTFPIYQRNQFLFENKIEKQLENEKTNKINLILDENNRKRKLFHKNSQIIKFFKPPHTGTENSGAWSKLNSLKENIKEKIKKLFKFIVEFHRFAGYFTETLLIKINSCFPAPSDEQYLDYLPRRSSFDFDLSVRKSFFNNELLIDFFSLISFCWFFFFCFFH